MAEFQEVMRQAKRMCETVNNCAACPLTDSYGNCYFDIVCGSHEDKYNCEFESIVMKWAAEHSELVYPTWEEWQKEQFPDARFPLSLCHFTKGICPKPKDPLAGSCDECCKNPIPADIAEKLGVKPKGGK